MAEKEIKATLLCVDDEPNILRALRRLFRGCDYKIHLAESGAEGLEILKNNPIDLIISDMRMPHMNGAEFLAKASELKPDTFRILLTGYADVQATIDAVNKGKIYKYLHKPWDDEGLKKTVEEALQLVFIKRERDDLLVEVQTQYEQIARWNRELEQKVAEKTQHLEQAMTSVKRANKDLKNSYIATVKTFASLVELKPALAKVSSRITSDIVKMMGRKLDLTDDKIQQTMIAALLHKLGKLSLPDELLDIAYLDMNQQQQQQYLNHPLMAETILMNIEPLEYAASLIRHQFEYLDNSGGPDQLKQEDMPLNLACLIVAVAYSEMVGGHYQSPALTRKEAIQAIKDGAESKYHPKAVAAFCSVMKSEEKEEKTPEVCTSVGGLQYGMSLSRDLVGKNGILLLSKGQIINEANLVKLLKYERSVDEKLKVFIKKRI